MSDNPQKLVHALPFDSASVLTRKRRRLDREASVAVETASNVTQSAVQPMVDPMLVDLSPFPLPSHPSSADFGGGNHNIDLHPPSRLPTPYPTIGVNSDLTPAPVPSGLALSLSRLEAESHAVRLRQSRAIQDDSQTGGTYARHVTRYQVWWESDQASRCAAEPGYTAIPPFPVTAAKVVMFLEYETTREKVIKISFFL
jgi:hypothetical protein